MAAWFKANKMAVNTKKTKYIIFHPRGKKIDMQGKEVVYNDNEEQDQDASRIHKLDRVHNNSEKAEYRAYKLLGIYIDENLSFDRNTKALTAKLARSIYSLNRVKNVLPQRLLMHLYNALISSYLQYCIIIASDTSNKNIEEICKMQKKAIRQSTYGTTICNA